MESGSTTSRCSDRDQQNLARVTGLPLKGRIFCRPLRAAIENASGIWHSPTDNWQGFTHLGGEDVAQDDVGADGGCGRRVGICDHCRGPRNRSGRHAHLAPRGGKDVHGRPLALWKQRFSINQGRCAARSDRILAGLHRPGVRPALGTLQPRCEQEDGLLAGIVRLELRR